MNLNRRMLLAAPSLLLVRPGAAQGAWPTRAIRLISSSPPAGASDILSRTLGNSLQMQAIRALFGRTSICRLRPPPKGRKAC